MKIMKYLSIALFLTTALVLQGCSDDDKGSTAATTLSVTRDGVEISEISCSMGEMTAMLAINTDGDWTASVPDADTTWLSITPHQGYGWEVNDTSATNTKSYIKVTVARNTGDARTSTITIVAGSLSKVITVSQNGRTNSSDDPIETVWDMIDNFTLGYNLGNTLDSNPTGDWWDPTGKTPTDYETSWGQPVTTQAIIDAIYDKGFKLFRVPVTWGAHMDENYQVDEAWMDRVEEVVNYVLSHDDAYCIINVMHDTGENGWLYADIDAYPTITVKFQALWEQIATRFRDYDGRLIFESFNEILNASYSWTAPSAGDGAYDAINNYQQDFVNVVRATGGNNEYRNLAVTTYSATSSQVPIDEFVLPTDVHDNHIYASIHSYDPYNFCNDNSGTNSDGSEYDWNVYVFDSSCTSEIDAVFSRLTTRFNNVGIPFILGEFGAIDEGKDMSERVSYATYVAQKLKAAGTTGLWWMGLYDRSSDNWYEDRIVSALFTAFGD